MDVFQALGLDMPDRACSMTVDSFSAVNDDELMELLAPVFGWEQAEASRNSLIMFPGDANHPANFLDGGAAAPPAPAAPAGGAGDGQATPAAAPHQPAAAVSPFSGLTQFDLFLGPDPTAPAPGTPLVASEPQQQPAVMPALPPVPGSGGPACGAAVPAGPAPFSAPVFASQPAHLGHQQLPQAFGGSTPVPPPHQVTTQVGQQQQQQQDYLTLLLLQQQQQQQQLLTALPPPPQQQQQLLTALPQQLQPAALQQLAGVLPLPAHPITTQPPQQQQAAAAGVKQQEQQLEQEEEGEEEHEQEQEHHNSSSRSATTRAGRRGDAGEAPAKRRGRPPKVPGQYSKGYEAIKRYRQKKKGMVEQMEAEVARKQAEVTQLQQEQAALRCRQQVLESNMTHQDTMLADLFALQMSVSGRQQSGPDIEATTAAALAGVQQALALQAGDAEGAAAAVAAAASAKQRRSAERQQRVKQDMMDDMPQYWRRYQAYVQAAAHALAQRFMASTSGGGGGEGGGSAGGAAGSGPPPFPFTMIETLNIWKISRLALATGNSSVGGSATSGGPLALKLAAEQPDNPDELADFTLNLSTGQHDVVPPELWTRVAAQVALHGDQRQQLEAAWRLYAVALVKLNAERRDLLRRLQDAAAAEEGGGGEQQAQAQQQGQQQQQLQGVNRRTARPALDIGMLYMDVLDAVERNLMRGRAIIMMFGWSLLCMLTNEQAARICVASWPYFPLVRAVVGALIGKSSLQA